MSHNITILQGGFGTELQRRGYYTQMPLWSAGANLERPDLVTEVHEEYLKAGADWITTNTFRTNLRTWQKIDKPNLAHESTQRAIECALKARANINPQALVGASITTVEDCYEPSQVPSNEELQEEHSWMIAEFNNHGVDFLLFETLNTIRETLVLLECAKQTNLPCYVSFVTNEQGNLLSGETLEETIAAITPLVPQGIMLNCRPIPTTQVAADILVKHYTGIKGVYANGHGKPAEHLWWHFDGEKGSEEYAQAALHWAEQGFSIIGGCCGTTPEYIKRLKNIFR